MTDVGTLPTGTITFLRSDVEGSMRLVQELGSRFDEVNAQHQALVRSACAEYGGHEVRTEGDAFFVVFPDAHDAVRAAVAIQKSIAVHAWPAGVRLRVRIGLHAGSAYRAGDDYGGLEVNRAARIAAAGHGEQIVISDAVRALVEADLPPGAAIRNLGWHRLKDLPQPQQLFQLDVEGLPTQFPQLRTASASVGNLTIRLTSFIDRADELAALQRLLEHNRLVTLTGPGGTGKTSLALELARQVAPDFPDGAWQVNLASLSEPSAVRATIARTLGLYDGPVDSAAARLDAYLADRTLLLVLDNFEHLLDAAPEVSGLLSGSPGLRVVATSRAPLRLAGEQEFPVPPLPVDSAAIQLFLDRARAARPALRGTPEETQHIAGICVALDGLPLGIELAAARVLTLPLAAIAERLARHQPLPGHGYRDLPQRHQTLDDTINWSYHLLTPTAQHLLAQLSVFVGGFDLEQAHEIARVDVLDDIVSLCEQSLLVPVESASGIRYRMLETIRAYAARRLDAAGETDTLRERHAQAYLGLAQRAATHYLRHDQAEWLDRLVADDANLRLAMLWAIETEDAAFGMRLGGAMWRYWVTTGRLAEGRELMARVLALSAAGERTEGRITGLDAAGSLAYWAGDHESMRDLYEEQLALAFEVGDAAAQANAAFNAAHSRFIWQDLTAGQAAVELALEKYREVDDEVGIARVEFSFAVMAIEAQIPELPRATLIELARRFRDLSDPAYESMACFALAWVAIREGNVREASGWGLRAMLLERPLHDVASMTIGLQESGAVLLELGDAEGAATVLGAFGSLSDRYGVRAPLAFERVLGVNTTNERINGQLGSDCAAEAARRGRVMTLDEISAYLVERLDALGIEPAEV